MKFSDDIQLKIVQFSKEQSQHYLEDAEMTYLEKLRRKGEQAKRKAGKKLMRFKGSSSQAVEAKNDMILYMSDYMGDLVSEGMSEESAFEKAKAELAASADSDQRADLQARLTQYYENRSPADYEIAGLLHGGFMIIGLAVGATIGYATCGGWQAFLNGGWINTLIGAGAGAIIGIGLALICNAVIMLGKTTQGDGSLEARV
ncbi:MAG: hypothetical protein LBK28_00890 [Propionibacteriaceae bacterium]|jgi:hypothetical protein|nr:hypothetical protein [Propionibacteriaceae bacterium]